MAKILVGISLLLLVGAAALGYLNKTNLDAKITELENTAQQAQSAIQERDAARAAETEAIEKAVAEAAKREQAESEAAAAKVATQEVETKANALTQQVTTLEGQIAELNEKLAAIPDAPVGADVAEVANLEAKVRELEAAVAATEEEKSILMAKVEEERTAAESLRAAEKRRVGGIMAKGLQGRVLAYNPAWNFVVINIGDRQGAAANAEMLVMRGSTMVGRIRITSVEPSSSIADVLPTTVTAGLQIQPGDTVIYPGS